MVPTLVSIAFLYPKPVQIVNVLSYPVFAVCFSYSLLGEIKAVNPANEG